MNFSLKNWFDSDTQQIAKDIAVYMSTIHPEAYWQVVVAKYPN